jgi:hypothetical protein
VLHSCFAMGGSAVSSGTDISVDVSEACLDPSTSVSFEKLQDAVQSIITGIGEDAHRDGLRDTPKVFSCMSVPCSLWSSKTP